MTATLFVPRPRYASGMSRVGVARMLSIAGHPAVVMPGAVLVGVSRLAPPAVFRQALLSALLVAVAVMAYSAVQVRRGRWSHVDASVREERRQLNLFLAVVLVLVAGGLWVAGRPWGVVAGVGSAALLVSVAHAARHSLKVSLHVAFSTFAAAFLWPRVGAVAVLLAFAVAVAWSRLVLRRHTLQEVVAGGALGCVVGALFLVVL
jgi:membrane-associated phospholipid phosphatase